MARKAFLREMHAADVELVLSWRNHPSVRRNMFNQHEISFEEHQRWFLDASQNSKTSLLILEVDSTPSGFLSLKASISEKVVDWGFYIAPNSPKGTGARLGELGLQYAFEQLLCHKVCGQALSFNERSINFHQRLGFKKEGILRQQFFDGQAYNDVVCFGLLLQEWLQCTKEGQDD